MARDWDYNVGQSHDAGHILLPARLLHPDDLYLADEDGNVDLSARKGFEVRMSARAVQRVLSRSATTRVPKLVEAGLLAEADNGWFRLDPGATLRSLFESWAAALPEPATDEDFARCRLAMQSSNSPLDRLPPLAVFVGIARLLGPERFRKLNLVNRYITNNRYPAEALFPLLDEAAVALGWSPGAKPKQRGGYDWEYNIGRHDPDGRILVEATMIHPDDRGPLLPCGRVDLSGVTSTIRVREIAVKRMLGASDGVETLREAGVIEVDGEWHLYNPASTKRSLYERWQRTLAMPRTMADFDFAKRMRNACAVPKGHLPPRVVIEGVARILGPRDAYTKGEINAYVHVGPNGRKELIAAIRAAAGITHMRDVRRGGAVPIGEEECAKLFPFLAGMPHTAFDPDPDLAEEYSGPDATSRKRLVALGVLRDAAATFAYARSPGLRHPGKLPAYLRAVARFERESLSNDATFDPTCADATTRAFLHFAFSQKLSVPLAPEVRDAAVRHVLIVFVEARRRLRGLDPDGSRGILARAPALPTDLASFREELRLRYGDLRPSQRINRKAVSDRVADRYERVVDAASFRTAQIRTDGEKTRAAIDVLLSSAKADHAYWDFEAEGPNLSERGLPVAGWQRRRYRLWRVDAADLSLTLDRAPDDEPAPDEWPGALTGEESARVTGTRVRKPRDAGEGRGRAILLHGAEFIVEHLETVETTGEGKAVNPWYVTLAACHALAPAGFLDVGQKERRAALIGRWGLPKHSETSAGLLTFDERRGVTARLGGASTRRYRRVFLPIEELDYAIRLAGHGLDCVVQTWCRRGAFLQQTEYAADWTPPKLETRLGWYAYEKSAKDRPLPDPRPFFAVADATYEEAMDLIEVNVRRSRYPDGVLPDIEPPPELAWKVGPQPFVFSLNGRCVEHRQLGHFLKILFANIGDFRFHDFRHASSNNAREDDVPLTIVKAGLGQRSLALAEYYSSRTELQILKAERRAIREKLLRINRIERARETR